MPTIVKKLKVGCTASILAAYHIADSDLFERFGENSESIRVTGVVTSLDDEHATIRLKVQDNEWSVQVPRKLARFEDEGKKWKYLSNDGQIVWDSITDSVITGFSSLKFLSM